MIERQKKHPRDRGSRAIVQRGIVMQSGSNMPSFIALAIGSLTRNLKPSAHHPEDYTLLAGCLRSQYNAPSPLESSFAVH